MIRSLLHRLRPTPPRVIVYTPGKDGGTATHQALTAAGVPSHHIHHLDPKALDQQMRPAIEAGKQPLAHLRTAYDLRPELVQKHPNDRFVLLIRDQLERTLAALYENLHRRGDGLTMASPPEDILAEWRERTNHTWGLEWINREYRDQLGIDVLSLPFDREGRVQHHPAHNLLVMRIDADASVKKQALSELVGRPVTLGRANVGAQKEYAESYAAVKAMAWAPEPLLAQIYGSAHHRHFWTEAELERMKARWREHRPKGG